MRRPTVDLRRLSAAVLMPAVVFVPLLLAPAACGSGSDGDGGTPIDRETFIATYVELRLAALRNPDREIAAEERERVLREHGVGDDDLIRFVEVHGGDVPYMEGIWTEIESRLDSLRSPSDTASS